MSSVHPCRSRSNYIEKVTSGRGKQGTWGNVDCSGKHRDEGVEGVLVEGVDLVEAVEQEEQHGSPIGHSLVLHHPTTNAFIRSCLEAGD